MVSNGEPSAPISVIWRIKCHWGTVHIILLTSAGVEIVLFTEARVDNVDNIVYCEGRLRNVGRQDDFPRIGRGGEEDFRLHIRGQVRIDGKNDELSDLRAEPSHTIL